MKYSEIEEKTKTLININKGFQYWIIDDEHFQREHTEMIPGKRIKEYGFWVIGTTAGGNAITISEKDDKIRFCDHTGWYDHKIKWVAKQDRTDREYSYTNVLEAQIVLANSFEELIHLIEMEQFDEIVDKYD